MSSKTHSKTEYFLRRLLSNSGFGGEFVRFADEIKTILLFSQIYLVVSSMFAVLIVMVAMSIPLNPAPVVMGLVTYSVYVGDRISDSKKEPEATAERAQFFLRHKTFFSVSTAVAYGIAVSIAVLGGPFELAITLIPGLFWIFYASDRLPTVGLPLKRLKKVLILNSSLVAFGWAFSIVFLPIAFGNLQITFSAILLFIYFFGTVFVGTELSNVRDIHDDNEDGTSTLPNTFGISRTRQILYFLELALIGLLGLAYFFGIFAANVVLAVILGIVFSLGLNALVGRVKNHGRLAILEEMKHIIVVFLIIGFGLM